MSRQRSEGFPPTHTPRPPTPTLTIYPLQSKSSPSRPKHPALPKGSCYLKWKKTNFFFLSDGSEKRGERCNGARGGAWQQPAPTNIPEMFENSRTRRQSYVTATRGASAGIIKGGLPALGQTVSESAPEKRLQSLRLLRQHLERRTPAASALASPHSGRI